MAYSSAESDRFLAKATGRTNVIQGLIKYHGLKDKKRRIPFHDSISVCAKQLYTTATIEFDKNYSEDQIEINGAPAAGREAEHVLNVVNYLRKITKRKEHFKLASKNSIPAGKGLGFSAASVRLHRDGGKQSPRLRSQNGTLERDR